METVRRWLEQLGLGQYAEVFADNDVDLEALGLLGERDLEKLGVSLGHRKKLLKAIAGLDGAEVSAAISGQLASVESLGAQAERRQLTVMFCDLVGSTELATRLDPEQLRDLMQAYQRACGEVIARYDGHVAQYLGDGLMVYFGWPRAHEDDAVRAIRAGLEMVEAVSRLTASTPTSARVGIHTGLVVVGETGRGDASIPKAAVGETPNIAARLQGLAESNSVMVSERTRTLAGGLFDYAAPGVPVLKGVTEPMSVFRVLGSRNIESRFEAARTDVALTPLVGREEEIALLLRRWREAEEGEGQVVLVGGEPGIGKSRLTRALRERLQDRVFTVLRYQSSPYHINSALYPVIDQVERAAGFAREDTSEHKLDKLHAVLVGGEALITESEPLLAAMLSLPLDRYPPLKLSPQKQKEKTLEALAAQVEALARRRPVLMIYEDVHWIDATSQEVLDLLVPRLHGLPILLIVTYRPEYAARWSEQAHVTLLSLNRLARRQGAELVAKLTEGKTLPQEVQEQILAHTDGVPLFVEELTKSILESKLLRDTGDRYVLNGPLPALAVPTTLRDSLIARLDRLAPIREVAQIGACIGREFSYDLLAAVSPLRGAKLDDALEQLSGTGLLFRRGAPPDALYTFKHALVQDAAYDSLLKSKRAHLHAQIAEALEKDFSDRVANEPEVLGYHFTQAGMHERAVPYLISAGRRSLSRVALAESISHLTTALNVVGRLPASAGRDSQELDIRILLGTAYLSFLGWATPEIGRTLEPARELASRLDDEEKLVPVLYYIWFHHAMRCEYDACMRAVEGVDALTSRKDSDAFVIARMTDAMTQGWMGNFRRWRLANDALLSAYDRAKHGHLVQIYNHDPKCAVQSWAGYWLCVSGYPDQARKAALEQLELSRRLRHPFNLCWGLMGGTWAFLWRGETREMREWLTEAHAIAREHAISYVTDVMMPWFDGYALIEEGRWADGHDQVASAAKIWRATGGVHQIPCAYGLLGKALIHLERYDEARDLLEEALKLIEDSGHRVDEAEVHRIRGELLWQQPTPNLQGAETSFFKALEVARAQEAKGWELRAATSMSRLWRAQGRRREASDLLLPVYSWFTEGFDTKDLKNAKALLEELS